MSENQDKPEKKEPLNLQKFHIEKELEKIAEEFLPQISDWLHTLGQTSPNLAIKRTLEIVEFIEPKKSKDGSKLPANTNIQINLTPASQDQTHQVQDKGLKLEINENKSEENLED